MANTLKDAIERSDYISYLLRLWRAGGDKEPLRGNEGPWRASLEIPHTGERIGFANLHELFDFLRNQTRAASEVNEGAQGLDCCLESGEMG